MFKKDEFAGKTAWERVYAVAPMLAKAVTGFLETVPARDKASGYEFEDVLTALVTALVEKDPQWDASRGAYTTFVGVIAKNIFAEIRGDARVVQSVRGNAAKLEAIAEAKANNRFTNSMRASEANLACSSSPISTLSAAELIQWESDMLADLEEEERLSECRQRALGLVRELHDPDQIAVMSLLLGATQDPMPTVAVAKHLGVSTSRVTAIRKQAESRLREVAGV